MPPEGTAPESRGHLRLSLQRIGQLFNSLDPSPFREKDLDDDAEQFLVSWARELHPHADLRLTLYLKEPPAEPEPERWIVDAIHHYFAERAQMIQAELHALLRRGRTSLLVGVPFLVVFTLLAQVVARQLEDPSGALLSEGLLIVGWVAMWRPLEIYLYDWWPIRDRMRLYRRMARMPVELRVTGP